MIRLSLLFLLGLAQFVTGAYDYAAVCLPTHRVNRPDYTSCIMYIHSGSQPTQVNITVYDGPAFLQLEPGEVYKIDFPPWLQPIEGAEVKAIRVQSDEEIQVLIYKGNSDPAGEYNDVYQVPPNRFGTYFITSAYPHQSCSSPSAANQFYLVSSFEDETTIEVTEKNRAPVEITLPSLGTYVTVSFDFLDLVASGTIISSNKPINVVSGNLCANNPTYSGSYVASIPPTSYLASEYAIPHLIAENISTPGFTLGVVAVENNTEVYFEGEVFQLPTTGSGATFDRRDTSNATFVNCSANCLAVQYTKYDVGLYGKFMLNLLPETDFYRQAFFTTLDIHPTSYISIILQGEEPGEDVFLNGVSLGYLDWQAGNGFTSAELSIAQGTYVMESWDERRFAAYVYTHSEKQVGGAGYTLLPPASQVVPPTSVPPTTPQPPPLLNYTLPQLTVRVNGTVFTDDGTDMTPQCAQAHSQNLNTQITEMVVEVNKAIGRDICLYASDIVVLSGTGFMIIDGPKSLVDIRHNLRVSGHNLASELESCAEEVSVYLADHSNWQQPIFPNVPGCSTLIFIPPHFDIVGSSWNCNNQGMEDTFTIQNTLIFKSEVSDVLETADGSVLDIECTVAYGNEAEKAGNDMLGTLAGMIAQAGCAGIMDTVSQTTSFTAFGKQAYFFTAFHYRPRQSASFDEFMSCAFPIHEATQQHNNWGTQPGSPFLPTPPGCPPLQHNEPTLDDEGYQWMCVSLS